MLEEGIKYSNRKRKKLYFRPIEAFVINKLLPFDIKLEAIDLEDPSQSQTLKGKKHKKSKNSLQFNNSNDSSDSLYTTNMKKTKRGLSIQSHQIHHEQKIKENAKNTRSIYKKESNIAKSKVSNKAPKLDGYIQPQNIKKKIKLSTKLKRKSLKIIKENIYKINIKCWKGLEKLLDHNQSRIFYEAHHPNHPSLQMIENKIQSKAYKTIYEFGNELRKLWGFYLKYYAYSAENYQFTYNMSEYSENIIIELEQMNDYSLPKEEIKQEYLTIEEKDKLTQDIKKLNQQDLQTMIKLLGNEIVKKDDDDKKKRIEIDIDTLSSESQIKLLKFVKRCIYHQEKEKQMNKEQLFDTNHIQQLKNDLGMFKDLNTSL